MPTYKSILTKLKENKSTIKKYGVKKIGLFGSYIRDEQKPTSDIDILYDNISWECEICHERITQIC